MLPLLVLCALAAWAMELAELAVVGLAHRSALTSWWELAMGSLWLAPTALCSALPAALIAWLVLVTLDGAAGPGRRWMLATIAAACAAAVTWFVATGRHFAEPGQRGGLTLLLAGCAGALAYGLHRRLAAAVQGSPRATGAAGLGLAFGLELVNRFVLVRLYPAFHVGLAGAALVAAAVSAGTLFRSRARGWSRPAAIASHGALAVASAALAAAAAPSAERLARFDNLRLLLVDHAPVLGQAVELAARLAPPRPLDAADPSTPSQSSGDAGGAGPSFAGRDIVLVTIDALRADHVGAYGYPRPTTPNLDELAQDAVLFERAYCPTPHTSYSVASLMTGKYMRPLLLQGAGADSETLATYLRTYGYRTAAFYPPAVFFIDPVRFASFEKSHFGFEYGKVEFLEGEGRVRQIAGYVDALPSDRRLFLWVHLFGPHEPYEAHAAHPFGDRDVDRYDSEVAAADAAAGTIIRLVRKARPGAIAIITADHGEEFGEHGGRYHGTTVYEEQVRVPLLISAPRLVPPRRVREVVQTIDLLPTLLAGLGVPASPRIRGRNLGALLSGARPEGPGLAYAETEESSLLAAGPHRLLCARKLGACRLFDVDRDPGERTDLATTEGALFTKLRAESRALGASQGRFERDGLRTETGAGWPPPVLRGIAGDADAAPDLAALLDDADVGIRRKAAELLFELNRPETAGALRLALGRDEDVTVRRWCALALTRLGQGAPLATDLFRGDDVRWRRLAALALAESGDAHGEAVLVDWWQHGAAADYGRALDLLGALARIRARTSVWPLVQSLGDVRLRPRIAETLAAIGDDLARGPLAAALAGERYQTARIALADSLVALGAREELARPLVRFLGVPDPLPGGVGYALRAGIVEFVGGPDDKGRRALATQSNVGVVVRLVVPKAGNGTGTRVIVRARAEGRSGEVRVGRRLEGIQYDRKGSLITHREAPRIHDSDYVSLTIPASPAWVEIAATLPEALGVAPGRAVELVVFGERHVSLEALAIVPFADELPPPPPEPWSAAGAEVAGAGGRDEGSREAAPR